MGTEETMRGRRKDFLPGSFVFHVGTNLCRAPKSSGEDVAYT